MKEVTEIYNDMLEVFEQKSGFQMDDTADLAVRLYAAAAQIQSLYAYADWALTQSFPQLATGQYLDYHAQLRGIQRQGGTAASGLLRFRIDQALDEDLTIAAGTACTTSGLVRFVTTEDGVIEAGQLYTDVAAAAEQPGTTGNVAAGSITRMTRAPEGVSGVTNPMAFSGGTADEDDESLRVRVLDSFIRLPNGANAVFYELRALQHPGVEAVQVIPRYQGIGTVAVVITGAGGVPQQALLDEVQEDLDAVREIAVDVDVLPAQVSDVDIEATIWPADGYSFADAKLAVEHAIEGWFNGKLLGKSVYRAAIGGCIYATGAVRNFTLVSPAQDLEADPMTLPKLGTILLSEGV